MKTHIPTIFRYWVVYERRLGGRYTDRIHAHQFPLGHNRCRRRRSTVCIRSVNNSAQHQYLPGDS